MSTKRNAPELLPATRLEAVKAYAQKNYEKGGWDYVIECISDAEILDVTKGAKTVLGALRMVSAQVKVMADYRADIQAEAKLDRQELMSCIKEERDWAIEQGKAKAEKRRAEQAADIVESDNIRLQSEMERYRRGIS